jgi:hypothetical protein
MALFGLVSSVSVVVLLGLRLQTLAQLDQKKFFHIKYNSLMIDVQHTNSITSSSMIDVMSIDALAKLAERFNTMILHGEEGSLHIYYVQAGGITYRFMINTNNTDSNIPESEAMYQQGEV